VNVTEHYDRLIDAENDPFRDPPALQEYMNQWDGEAFISRLQLDEGKKVLEIGIGTGRLAGQTASCCKHLTGIDLSPKTIRRAAENLCDAPNVTLICGDFLAYPFNDTYDVIYASLTMMHFQDKQQMIQKVAALLNRRGIFCLSIDKNQRKWIEMGEYRLRVYPDRLETTLNLLAASAMQITDVCETPFAYIIVSTKE